MRILVTRPEPEASALAARLRARGHEALVEPVMRIILSQQPRDRLAPAAIALTSRNGVRAIAAWPAAEGWRNVSVYAVGSATAAAARAAGFREVRTADGDGRALAALISRDFDPSRGAVLYAAARERSVELADLLPEHAVATVEAYRTEPAAELSAATAEAIGSGAVDTVLLYSRRSAEIFCALVAEAGVWHGLAQARLCALSAHVAEPLTDLGSTVLVAPHPDEASLLGLIDPALARPA